MHTIPPYTKQRNIHADNENSKTMHVCMKRLKPYICENQYLKKGTYTHRNEHVCTFLFLFFLLQKVNLKIPAMHHHKISFRQIVHLQCETILPQILLFWGCLLLFLLEHDVFWSSFLFFFFLYLQLTFRFMATPAVCKLVSQSSSKRRNLFLVLLILHEVSRWTRVGIPIQGLSSRGL